MSLDAQPEELQGQDKKKSSSAFRTIGEVSAELGLPTHVLRFWESKFIQIKPHKRRGGHRYYRPADVDLLKEVKILLYEKGFTIKGAQKYLKEIKKDKVTIEQPSLFNAGDDSSKPVTKSDDKVILRKILNELIEVRSLLDQDS